MDYFDDAPIMDLLAVLNAADMEDGNNQLEDLAVNPGPNAYIANPVSRSILLLL